MLAFIQLQQPGEAFAGFLRDQVENLATRLG